MKKKKKIKLLLYCSKGKVGLYDNRKKITGALENFFLDKLGYDKPPLLNGKIVGECDYEVEEIIANDVNLYDEYGIKYTTKNGYSHIDDNFEALLDNSCLNAFELNDYLGGYGGYAINIENLYIFDEPKELNDYLQSTLPNPKHIKFANWKANYYWALGDYAIKNSKMTCEKLVETFNNLISVKKAPQNMMYAFDYYGNPFVLISIRPELMCKILNGECTTIVNKNILKGMLENGN